jgi:hypothetical protein
MPIDVKIYQIKTNSFVLTAWIFNAFKLIYLSMECVEIIILINAKSLIL